MANRKLEVACKFLCELVGIGLSAFSASTFPMFVCGILCKNRDHHNEGVQGHSEDDGDIQKDGGDDQRQGRASVAIGQIKLEQKHFGKIFEKFKLPDYLNLH